MDVPVLDGLRPDGSADPEVAGRAARAWLAGGIVGLPTETVYGLAADAQVSEAVSRVYRAKGRPADHPLIVHVQGAQALAAWSVGPNPAADRLADAFWPGALTLIVERSTRAGDFITGGQGTVALRSPDHPVARACLEALVTLSGDPARGVAAPSANRFGRVSPTRASDVLAEVGTALDPARDMVVDGGACAIGVESTIVDCTANPPRVLRLGAISQEQIDAVLAGAAIAREGAGGAPSGRGDLVRPELGGGATLGDGVVEGATGDGRGDGAVEGATGDVRAPGTLEAHYAPMAQVLLIEPSSASATNLAAALHRACGPSPGDPCRLAPLEGAQPARIMGLGPGSGNRIGLVAAFGVETPDGWTRLTAPTTPAQYARDLYAALRLADSLGLTAVVAVLPDPASGPLALAVRDRLTRAAHGSRA